MYYKEVDSPIGPLLLAGDDEGLRFLLFKNGRDKARPQPDWEPDRNMLKDAAKQVGAYFSGRLKEFDLPLAPQGTPFQTSVWKALLKIPYGETVSYGTIAKRLGKPNAMRAVGLANGSNPIAIVIPCHRVIGSNGSLTGYGGGLPIKQALLALERGQGKLL
jgi:methylated-DNA-[protein]-cysteine S-methyltransferase